MVVKSDAYLPINTDDLSKSKVSKVSDLLNIQNGTTAIKANDDLEARIQQQQFGSNVKDKVVFASENGSCNGNEPLNRSCPNAKVMTNVEGSQRESETLTLANIQATNETKSKNIDDYESQQQLRLENNLHKNPIINNTDEDANGQCDIDNNLQEDEECEEDSAPQVPQVKEGGWGWFVVLGTFICYWLVPGMIRSYGAVYLEILETFPEATAAEAGWVPALLSSISIGLGMY